MLFAKKVMLMHLVIPACDPNLVRNGKFYNI